MKRMISLMLMVAICVAALFAFASCDFLPEQEYSYVLSDKTNNWTVPTDSSNHSKLDPDYLLEAISADDIRIGSIKAQVSAAQSLYLVQHDFVDYSTDTKVAYTLAQGGERVSVSESMCIRIAETYYKELEGGGTWKINWIPGDGEVTVKSITPYTLYCPPHSSTETYPGSGTWSDSPIVLKSGSYYIVLAKYSDGTFGLGAVDTGYRTDEDYSYVITGNFNGWGVPFSDDSKTQIDSKYQMKAIAPYDVRLSSISSKLKKFKYLYAVEHTVSDTGAGWNFGYSLTPGAPKTTFDGNQAIKVVKTKYIEENGIGEWEQNWLPDAGNTTVVSLTPDTLYCPPHNESPIYDNSGAWNDNPAILRAGTYLIVFVQYTDGTFGIGAIESESSNNTGNNSNLSVDTAYSYVITGQFNGWAVPCIDKNRTTLDPAYSMQAITVSDKRVASIKDKLENVSSIYIIEHTVSDTGAGWNFGYSLSSGAEKTMFDGNQAIKIIKTRYIEVDGIGAWEQNWLPDAGNTTVVSLTPDTLYCPPHNESPIYDNSGAWNDNPAILRAGTYLIVFVQYTDGTFGIGAIAE